MWEGKGDNDQFRAMQQENIPFFTELFKNPIPATHIGQAILHSNYETLRPVTPQEIPVDKELL